MRNEYIFVYGTLRRETGHLMYHILARYADFIGDGYVHGKLYEVGGYPGMKLSENPVEKVYGEVYRLRDPDYVLKVLDEYEECNENYPEPHEYTRIQVTVHLTDGRVLQAWAYEYNYPTDTLELIPSGNYIEYIANKSNSL